MPNRSGQSPPAGAGDVGDEVVDDILRRIDGRRRLRPVHETAIWDTLGN